VTPYGRLVVGHRALTSSLLGAHLQHLPGGAAPRPASSGQVPGPGEQGRGVRVGQRTRHRLVVRAAARSSRYPGPFRLRRALASPITSIATRGAQSARSGPRGAPRGLGVGAPRKRGSAARTPAGRAASVRWSARAAGAVPVRASRRRCPRRTARDSPRDARQRPVTGRRRPRRADRHRGQHRGECRVAAARRRRARGPPRAASSGTQQRGGTDSSGATSTAA
jgi:hypothetical protein